MNGAIFYKKIFIQIGKENLPKKLCHSSKEIFSKEMEKDLHYISLDVEVRVQRSLFQVSVLENS